MHVKHRKKLKAVRGSYLPFVIKHALFPSRNHEPSSELLRFVRRVSKLSSNMPIFLPHHLGGMTLHQARFHVFLMFFFIFLELKCHVTSCICMHACVHVVRQICLKIPSSLLHMELTRTQVHKYDFSNCYG